MLASASVEVVVKEQGELSVVDADAEGPGRADDEEAALPGPLPDIHGPVERDVEHEGLAAAEGLVAITKGVADEGPEPVALHVPDEQDGGLAFVRLIRVNDNLKTSTS